MIYRWLTDMALWLRADPLLAPHVIEWPGWQERGRPQSVGGFDPHFVLWHDTVDNAGTNWEPVAKYVFEIGRADAPAPIYHVLQTRPLADGFPKIVVGSCGRANHAGSGVWPDGTSGNGYGVGYSVMKNGIDEAWSPVEVQFFAHGTAAITHGLGTGAKANLGHSHYAPGRKIDPSGPAEGFATLAAQSWPLPNIQYASSLALAQYLPRPPVPPPTAAPTIKRGATGQWVTYLQATLDHGWPAMIVDGIFGSLTDKIVRKFQAANGLIVDGIVGPQTWPVVDLMAVRFGVPRPG